MKKSLTIVGIAILAVLAIGGAILVAKNSRSGKLSPVLGPDEALPTPADRYLTWEDPAGFKFTYPTEVKIDSHPEDKVNYANLDLTAEGQGGGIKILVADNAYKNLDDWAKKQRSTGGQVLDSTLGDREAKKAIFITPAKIIIAAIDVEALVLLEADLGTDDYWQEAFDGVVSSFEFIPLPSEPTQAPAAKTGSSGGSNTGVIEEEEVVVE